ncbi:hypothetical protein BGZ54_000794, partial [Gamsiella multidivaricata]
GRLEGTTRSAITKPLVLDPGLYDIQPAELERFKSSSGLPASLRSAPTANLHDFFTHLVAKGAYICRPYADDSSDDEVGREPQKSETELQPQRDDNSNSKQQAKIKKRKGKKRKNKKKPKQQDAESSTPLPDDVPLLRPDPIKEDKESALQKQIELAVNNMPKKPSRDPQEPPNKALWERAQYLPGGLQEFIQSYQPRVKHLNIVRPRNSDDDDDDDSAGHNWRDLIDFEGCDIDPSEETDTQQDYAFLYRLLEDLWTKYLTSQRNLNHKTEMLITLQENYNDYKKAQEGEISAAERRVTEARKNLAVSEKEQRQLQLRTEEHFNFLLDPYLQLDTAIDQKSEIINRLKERLRQKNDAHKEECQKQRGEIEELESKLIKATDAASVEYTERARLRQRSQLSEDMLCQFDGLQTRFEAQEKENWTLRSENHDLVLDIERLQSLLSFARTDDDQSSNSSKDSSELDQRSLWEQLGAANPDHMVESDVTSGPNDASESNSGDQDAPVINSVDNASSGSDPSELPASIIQKESAGASQDSQLQHENESSDVGDISSEDAEIDRGTTVSTCEQDNMSLSPSSSASESTEEEQDLDHNDEQEHEALTGQGTRAMDFSKSNLDKDHTGAKDRDSDHDQGHDHNKDHSQSHYGDPDHDNNQDYPDNCDHDGNCGPERVYDGEFRRFHDHDHDRDHRNDHGIDRDHDYDQRIRDDCPVAVSAALPDSFGLALESSQESGTIGEDSTDGVPQELQGPQNIGDEDSQHIEEGLSDYCRRDLSQVSEGDLTQHSEEIEEKALLELFDGDIGESISSGCDDSFDNSAFDYDAFEDDTFEEDAFKDAPGRNVLETQDGEVLDRLPTPLPDDDDADDYLNDDPARPLSFADALDLVLEHILREVLDRVEPLLQSHVNLVQEQLEQYCRENQGTLIEQIRALSGQIEHISQFLEMLRCQDSFRDHTQQLFLRALEDYARGLAELKQRLDGHDQERQINAQAFQYLDNMRNALDLKQQELQRALKDLQDRGVSLPPMPDIQLKPWYPSWQLMILLSVLFNLIAFAILSLYLGGEVVSDPNGMVSVLASIYHEELASEQKISRLGIMFRLFWKMLFWLGQMLTYQSAGVSYIRT